MYVTNNFAFFMPFSLILSSLIISVLSTQGMRKKINFKQDRSSLFLLFSFSVTLLISLLHNSSSRMFMNIAGLLIFLLVAIVFLNKIQSVDFKLSLIYKSSLYFVSLLIFTPILLYGIKFTDYFGYQGIFYNPNSFGNIVSTFSVLLFSFFTPNVLEKNITKVKVLSYLLLLFILFYLMLLSSSRSSILTTIFVYSLIIFQVLRDKKSTIRINKYIILLVVTTFIFLVFMSGIFNDLFETRLINKFSRHEDEITSGRVYVWKIIVDKANFFGNGTEFMKNLPIGAHNTYLSILGQFGFVNLILYLLILLRIIIRSYCFLIRSYSKYRYIPFFITIALIMLSFTEGMLMKYSMLITFLSYGSIINFKHYEDTTNNQ